MSEKDEIIRIAAQNALYLCRTWLPRGRIEAKNEWVALNPKRDDRNYGSFKIRIGGSRAGCWSDFKTGDKGQNMVTLYCFLKNLNPSVKKDYHKAIKEISEMLGISNGNDEYAA